MVIRTSGKLIYRQTKTKIITNTRSENDFLKVPFNEADDGSLHFMVGTSSIQIPAFGSA